jgi:hypothetical protein
LLVALPLTLGSGGCDERAENSPDAGDLGTAGGADDGESGAGGDELAPSSSAGASGAPDSTGYGGSGTEGDTCLPGLTRCHGQLGFQRCTPEGVWGVTQTCGGYSENGTSSYCALVDSGEEPWAACVDPACWWWIDSGLAGAEDQAGVCVGTSSLRPCHVDGILGRAIPCSGVCRTVGELDGRALGYCDPLCEDGERECLAGPLYRECQGGVWSSSARVCEGGEECQPLSLGIHSDIKCGGACELGSSRCSADGTSVESCTEQGEWEAMAPCLLGRCVRSGAQAQCQTECAPGQRACASDGAASEAVCGETGLWGEPTPCEVGSSCRVGTSGALGCVECVGSELSGGNAWGVADSYCEAAALVACGPDNAYQAAEPCAGGQSCVELSRGAARLAYCQ